MRHSSFLSRIAAGLLVVMASAVPSATLAGELSACELSAWSNDTDPQGLNVRAAPGTSAAVIGQIPFSNGYAAELSITGSKDGWFRIDKAVLEDYDTPEPQTLFEGDGWVSGRLLGLLLNDTNLHSAPAADSAVVAHLSNADQSDGPDSFDVTRLHACAGDWVDVEGTFLGAHLRGWATRTCSNQVTTCP